MSEKLPIGARVEVCEALGLDWASYFPGFISAHDRDHDRSQALALAEWLADRIYSMGSDLYAQQLVRLMANKDVAALEQLVIDLRGKHG